MSLFESGDLYGSFQPEEPVTQKQQLPPPPSPPPIQQKKQPDEAIYYHHRPEPQQTEGFFDRIASKRFEILKVISFALIIVFAISIDRVNMHYLTQYVSNSILTGTQEFFLRLSYPVTVLIIIWLIKVA
jgi:hypothetical protein